MEKLHSSDFWSLGSPILHLRRQRQNIIPHITSEKDYSQKGTSFTTKWNVQFGTSQQNYVKTKSNLRFPPFYPTSPCRYCEWNNTNFSALYWIFHRLLFVWLFVMSQQNWKLCSHTTVLITRIIDLLEKFCLVKIRQSGIFCQFWIWKKRTSRHNFAFLDF